VTTATTAPVENIVRAVFGPESAELRAQTDGEDGGTLFGHFAVFNRWTEIRSSWEGHFLERIAPGAFAATMRDRLKQIKVLYDHGQDPQLGNKPLGAIRSLGEDAVGAFYEVDLLRDDTGKLIPYNREFIVPAAKAGVLGASFRFGVAEDGEEWDHTPHRSAHNPLGLAERTITRINPLHEFGPVSFPAYVGATAGVRSGTDRWLDSLINDPRFIARFTERVGGDVVERIIAGLPPKAAPSDEERAADGPPGAETTAIADGDEGDHITRRIDHFQRSTAGFDAHLSRLKEATT
jgi:HK97 family phage prohead protease